ncbi:MAG: iron-containing alcohol dehydrogenase, partial [Actinobacteria bacterium]|nr:iron-containing alcohol dehydrogenase [Actinomycetota bacterium]
VGAAHGEALAAVLAEVMEFNSRQVAEVYATVGNDMGVSTSAPAAIDAVRSLADDINIRFSLSHYGVTESMVEAITATVQADSVTSSNPIVPTDAEVAAILTSRLRE